MIPQVGMYLIGYAMFCLCVIFPPTELISAGLSLDKLFSFLLGNEHLDFIGFHIRRTALIPIAHSLLPFGFFMLLSFVDESVQVLSIALNGPSLFWQLAFVASALLPAGVAAVVAYWMSHSCHSHPLVKVLRLYDQEWQSVASAINTEYRRFDKFTVTLGGIKRVVVTDSWIIVTENYGVRLAHQADARMTVVRTDEHVLSHHGEMTVQFLNILVENISKPIDPFYLRLNAFDYRDMRAKLQAPVETARNVIIHQSLSERFVEAFAQHAMANPPAVITPELAASLDRCMGCMQEMSNVKLEKRCINSVEPQVDEDGQQVPNCRQCYCRPMWCLACMGRWFASRQDQHRPDTWLGGKSPCPTCRSTFCLLDVSVTPLQ